MAMTTDEWSSWYKKQFGTEFQSGVDPRTSGGHAYIAPPQQSAYQQQGKNWWDWSGLNLPQPGAWLSNLLGLPDYSKPSMEKQGIMSLAGLGLAGGMPAGGGGGLLGTQVGGLRLPSWLGGTKAAQSVPAWFQASKGAVQGAPSVEAGLGTQLAGAGAPQTASWLGRLGQSITNQPIKGVPWWVKTGVPAAGLGGYGAYANLAGVGEGAGEGTAPWGAGTDYPTMQDYMAAKNVELFGGGGESGLPEAGAGGGVYWNPTTGKYETDPSTMPIIVTDENGDRWYYDQMAGTWSLLGGAGGAGGALTFEQQMEMLQEQYRLQLEQQEAYAAQQQQMMYEADPYKYWAQMGQGTPGAVARLTGGEIGAGEPFEQGVGMSTPSSQWWNNLIPSEQQQIMGGVNWLGIDPEDYYAMYKRMIPGLGSRQVEPVWAR